MKILLSAYACEPHKGSEPGVGWNLARELARFHEIWVITRADHGPAIRAELTFNPQPNLHVICYELPWWMRPGWWRGRRGVHLHYYLWQAMIYPLARRLHQAIGFDLIHHITYVRYCSPSFVSLLPVPFVWGPVGGGESAPQSFREDFSRAGRCYELLRDAARGLGEIDPCIRLTARRAAWAAATTADTATRMQQIGATKVHICSEAALSDDELAFLAAPVPLRPPPTFISVGRLLSWKGFHLAIRAFARLDLSDAEYWILGDGPERRRLQKLAEKLGVSRRIRFWPALPRQDALYRIKQCVALVHPSLHDSGGWVCLEAMAASRPVICLDLGGPATQVTPDTGIKVIAHDPEQAVTDIANAMRRLACDAELRARMGNAGRQRVLAHYRWRTRAEYFCTVYAQVVEHARETRQVRTPRSTDRKLKNTQPAHGTS